MECVSCTVHLVPELFDVCGVCMHIDHYHHHMSAFFHPAVNVCVTVDVFVIVAVMVFE